jgi:hypothetical protein
MAKSFWNSLLFITTCFTLCAFALAYGFARGIISARGLGVGFLILVGCLALVVSFRLRKGVTGSKNESSPSSRKASSFRVLQAAVVALALMLIFGLWLTRGDPLAPRLVGAAMNIFLTCWFISLLRRANRN